MLLDDPAVVVALDVVASGRSREWIVSSVISRAGASSSGGDAVSGASGKGTNEATGRPEGNQVGTGLNGGLGGSNLRVDDLFAQIFFGDEVAARDDDGAFNDVFQFAHIALPAISFKQR